MFFLRLKALLVLILALYLAACSGGGGEDVVGGSDSNTGGTPEATNAFSLAWKAPSRREDSSELLKTEIAGYRIYYGSDAGDYSSQVDVDGASVNNVQVADLSPGTYYVVMTTVDIDGRESAYSSIIEKQPAPVFIIR